MRKYKVITDNLDWLGFNKGDYILERIDGSFWRAISPNDGRRLEIFPNQKLNSLLETHSDWLEEVSEPSGLYTEAEVRDYGNYVTSVNMERFIDTKNDPFKWWLKYRKNRPV